MQPGGTTNIITNNWTSRIIDKGTDPFGLGRWSYLVLRGVANKKILSITTYRVCQQTILSTGTTTSTAQQFRKLSGMFCESGIIEDPRPRLQFIMDLQSWIESRIQQHYEVILSLDANEAIADTMGLYCPLEFNPDRPTVGSGHDGSLSTLIRTCGLCNPLTLQHSDRTPPTTYSRGPNRINYILVSNSLLSSVIRSGILPFNSVFLSDHHPCFLDFDAYALFCKSTAVKTVRYWRLRLKQAKGVIVSEYLIK
jgi:hypothetical protein